MKKPQLLLNILLITLVLVGDVFYILKGTLLIKSITSGAFVLLGIVNLIFALKEKNLNRKFCFLLLTGLFFAMLGDIVLELHFIMGALLFAVGHIFFFMAYCCLIPFRGKDLIAGACVFTPVTLFIVLAPIFEFGGILMQAVCIFYALIISCMLGKSITNFIKEKSLLNLILLLGSALFTFSDFMLLLNVFASLPRIVGILCLAIYYPAEILLAISLGFSNKTKA